MYGSLRFYIDSWPNIICATSILNIIDMFSRGLGAPFSQIVHILDNIDEDHPIVYVEYENNKSGRNAFLTNEFISEFTGKYGNSSAPLVQATCNCGANSIYSNISIDIQLPYSTNPMIVRVNFDYKYISNPLTLSTYKLFIANLYYMGFRVNNSFFHVYHKMNTAMNLDGGQIGALVSFKDKRIIKLAVSHRKKSNLNCIVDVFCINSIRKTLIREPTRVEIASVVGDSFATTVADNFIFSLPVSGAITAHYRAKYGNMVKKLRKIIGAEGLLL